MGVRGIVRSIDPNEVYSLPTEEENYYSCMKLKLDMFIFEARELDKKGWNNAQIANYYELLRFDYNSWLREKKNENKRIK